MKSGQAARIEYSSAPISPEACHSCGFDYPASCRMQSPPKIIAKGNPGRIEVVVFLAEIVTTCLAPGELGAI